MWSLSQFNSVCALCMFLWACVTGLPAFMNMILEKLTVHVKRECAICHEMGEPCGAAKLCRDPLDIIFPFQVLRYVHYNHRSL